MNMGVGGLFVAGLFMAAGGYDLHISVGLGFMWIAVYLGARDLR